MWVHRLTFRFWGKNVHLVSPEYPFRYCAKYKGQLRRRRQRRRQLGVLRMCLLYRAGTPRGLADVDRAAREAWDWHGGGVARGAGWRRLGGMQALSAPPPAGGKGHGRLEIRT